MRTGKFIKAFIHLDLSDWFKNNRTKLVLGLLSLCLLSACSPTMGLKNSGRTVVHRNELYLPIDKYEKKTAWFNISIYFFKNEQSGQLLVKQTNDTTTRVLFTTPVGFKIFDFAITPHDFKVLACIDPLRKQNILHIMEKDFRLMFCASDAYVSSKRYTGKSDTSLVVYKLHSLGKSYYWINKQKKGLYKIDNHSFPIGGARVSFDYTDGSLLPTIRLKQKGIKLRFELVPFKVE
jgi:hypothetical protein